MLSDVRRRPGCHGDNNVSAIHQPGARCVRSFVVTSPGRPPRQLMDAVYHHFFAITTQRASREAQKPRYSHMPRGIYTSDLQQIHCVSKNAPTLKRYSSKLQRSILMMLKRLQNRVCMFQFSCKFAFISTFRLSNRTAKITPILTLHANAPT